MTRTNIEFKIEKNVPLPTAVSQHGKTYPFATMQPGDSFTFPKNLRGRISSNAASFQKKHSGVKFTLTTKTPGTKGRLWRMK